jgi:hypothetical protein
LSGVTVAAMSLDTQVHDTYFVVAPFHYVLFGGALAPRAQSDGPDERASVIGSVAPRGPHGARIVVPSHNT